MFEEKVLAKKVVRKMEFPGRAANRPHGPDPKSERESPRHEVAIESDAPLYQSSLQLSLLAIQLGTGARDIREEINRQLETAGLVEIDLVVLCLLKAEPDGRLSQTELAVQLPLSPARISRAVDHLRGSGWLAVERDTNDRRRQFVCLTDDGSQHLQGTLLELSPLLKSVVERFPEQELAAWAVNVKKLRDAIQSASSGTPTTTLPPSAASELDPRKGAA